MPSGEGPNELRLDSFGPLRILRQGGAWRIGAIETGIGANDHDGRPGLDPVVGDGRLCSIRVYLSWLRNLLN